MFRTENTLFVEKYRPSELDNYVCSSLMKETIQSYIDKQDIPHLLLYGDAGTGKTTLAKLLVKNIECDHIYINASDENNVDTVREKIKMFASSVGFSPLKIVILDESEYLTPNAQAALRNLMETFSQTTRFILTCNYVEKVIDPIQSRCQSFNITPPSKPEVAKHIVDILTAESVTHDVQDIVTVINSNYPDIRRIINTTQRLVVDNVLKLDKISIIETNYTTKVLEMMSGSDSIKDKFKSIRKFLADNQVRDYQNLFRDLYDNSETLFQDQPSALLDIAEYQYKAAFVVDQEINIMALLTKLLNNVK